MSKSKILPIAFFSLILCIISCSTTNTAGAWLIPQEEVQDGGPGKDGIPSVDDPKFASVNDVNYLRDQDLVVGFKNEAVIRAYAHRVLDWHEIVNDAVGDIDIAITYCPLTGSAVGWDRTINGQASTFGVSGQLYNTNLIPYDRATDSNWSQFRLDCVNGQLAGEPIQTHQVIETTFGTWKAMFPNSEIITTETGFNRDYSRFPYINGSGQDYRTDPWLIFNVNPFDDRLPLKERVLGVISTNQTKAYRFSSFPTGTTVIEDTLDGQDIIVIGNRSKNFMVAFARTLPDGSRLNFTGLDNTTAIMQDNEGNEWNIFGEAISGNRVGQKLENVESFIGYWVAWGAFYPGLEVYE